MMICTNTERIMLENRWVITGYLVSLVAITLVFLNFDTPIIDFLITCFVAWCGGFFFRELMDKYTIRGKKHGKT